MKRTEDQMLAKAPVEVTFGEKKYKIKPLTILKQRKWREQLTDELKSVLGEFDKRVSTDSMAAGLTRALVQFPEKLAELVFSYAPDLPREEIMEEATEEQIAYAFSCIMEVAYPFLAQLQQTSALARAGLSQ